jgi:hypothetical protein
VRYCSSHLQQAAKYDEEDLLVHFNKPAEQEQFYYPTDEPFKHNPDIGEQFKVIYWGNCEGKISMTREMRKPWIFSFFTQREVLQ